ADAEGRHAGRAAEARSGRLLHGSPLGGGVAVTAKRACSSGASGMPRRSNCLTRRTVTRRASVAVVGQRVRRRAGGGSSAGSKRMFHKRSVTAGLPSRRGTFPAD